jgi:hypothetical protein
MKCHIGCNEKIKSIDKLLHESECSEKIISCEYDCNQTFPKKNLEEHNKINIEIHFKKLCEKLINYKTIQIEHKKLKNELENYKISENVKDLLIENKKLKSELDSYKFNFINLETENKKFKEELKKAKEFTKFSTSIQNEVETEISNNSISHKSIKCDKCGSKNFEGIRYSCNMCDNYDLCENCFPDREKFHNTQHFFTSYDECQSVKRNTVHNKIQCNDCYSKNIIGNRFVNF